MNEDKETIRKILKENDDAVIAFLKQMDNGMIGIIKEIVDDGSDTQVAFVENMLRNYLNIFEEGKRKNDINKTKS